MTSCNMNRSPSPVVVGRRSSAPSCALSAALGHPIYANSQHAYGSCVALHQSFTDRTFTDRIAPTATGSQAATHMPAMAVPITRGQLPNCGWTAGEGADWTLPASMSAHAITTLSRASRSTPGTRQTTHALDNRKAATKYPAAWTNQGIEKNVSARATEPA